MTLPGFPMPGAVTPSRKHYLAPQLTLENAAEALRRHRGIVTYAAKALGVSRPTLYSFINEHPELKELRYQLEEDLLDVAEKHVADWIEAGDQRATLWFLERRGRHRGYSQRTDLTTDGGGVLEGVPYQRIERRIVDPKEPME